MTPRRQRVVRWGITVVVAGAVAALAWQARAPGLAAAGHWLYKEDVIARADLVAVLSGNPAAAWLEAADSAREFPQARVAIFEADPPSIEQEFARRGASFPFSAALEKDTLVSLGIAPGRIVLLPSGEGGTNAELGALKAWLAAHPVSAPVVITAWHHSARARRILRREFPEPAGRPAVRVSRFERDLPAGWWRERSALREGLIEMQKLGLDVVRHPFQ